MKKTVVALFIGSIILAPLCAGGSKENAAPAKKTEILISAAASLTNCIQDLSAMYTEKNPQVTITAISVHREPCSSKLNRALRQIFSFPPALSR